MLPYMCLLACLHMQLHVQYVCKYVLLWIRHACNPAFCLCVRIHDYVCVLVAVCFSILGLSQGALINFLQALSTLDAELRERDAG